VFERAIAEKVAFVPGGCFFPEPDDLVGPVLSGSGYARLCFTFADSDEISEGCQRLARALE
jgi:DNA-binding transcriptional MocR family regulator